MKLNYTDGCTCFSLTVDDKETADMSPEELHNVIRKSIDKVSDTGTLQSILESIVMQADGTVYEYLGHCEECGDNITQYTLEVEDE